MLYGYYCVVGLLLCWIYYCGLGYYCAPRVIIALGLLLCKGFIIVQSLCLRWGLLWCWDYYCAGVTIVHVVIIVLFWCCRFLVALIHAGGYHCYPCH